MPLESLPKTTPPALTTSSLTPSPEPHGPVARSADALYPCSWPLVGCMQWVNADVLMYPKSTLSLTEGAWCSWAAALEVYHWRHVFNLREVDLF